MAAAPKFHKQSMKYNENIIAYQLCFSHIRAGDFVSVSADYTPKKQEVNISISPKKRAYFTPFSGSICAC